MTKDEALRLALEALEYEAQKGNDNAYQFEREAIKAALEAKDEPVAWAMLHDNGHFIDAIHPNEHARVEGEYITPLYTTPPQRKPLTEKELNVLGTQWHFNLLETKDKTELFAFARAIEAAHGIKGEA
jgi:hypothetical protein